MSFKMQYLLNLNYQSIEKIWKEENLCTCTGENDDQDCEEEIVENVSEPVCSIIECSEYVEKFKNFARVHGKASMLESVIDIDELLNEMKMEISRKQTKISDIFGKK